jgi:hypothetical protein
MQYNTDKWLTQKWETGSRYYVATVMQNLFGQWEVDRSWGSKQSKRGGGMVTITDSFDEAVSMMDDIDKRRQLRKYIKVST